MNHNFVYALGAVLVAGAGVADVSQAQRAIVDARHGTETTTVSSPLERQVTVKLDAVDVPTAVKTIAERAGIRVQYRNALFHGVNSRVTLDANAMSLQMAMDRVLLGLPIRVVVLDDDLIGLKASLALTDGVVTGKVVHAKTGQPLAGVTITIGESSKSVITGSDGTFRVTATPGEHRVTVRHVGFVRQVRTVQVGDGATVSLEVRLEPSASVLDEVVVTGTVIATERKAIPNPITVITADEIEKRGITRVDQFFRGEVPGVLALEQGAQAYGNQRLGAMATSKVYVRGSSTLDRAPNPMKVYIDGVEMFDPAYLGTIDPASVERIEIITGPQAATIYGSGAIGGVMQIFTKKSIESNAQDMKIFLKYGILQNNISDGRTPSHAHALNVTGSSGPGFSYAGSMSYTYSGQWQPNLFNRRIGASLGATHVRDRLKVTATMRLTTGRNGTNDDVGLMSFLRDAGEKWSSTFFRYSPGGKIATSFSQGTAVNMDYRLSQVWQHHLSVGRNENTFRVLPIKPRFYNPEDSLFRYRNSHGARVTAGYNINILPSRLGVVSQTLTLGVNGSRGENLQASGCGISDVSTVPYVECDGELLDGDVAGVDVDQSTKNWQWGVFGQWRAGVWDQLFITLGVRGERNDAYGEAHKIDWTPTNGITYTFEYRLATIKLYGSYGRSTRAPREDQRRENMHTSARTKPSQYITRFSNPELRPEHARGPQGGIELYYGNLLTLAVNHYQQRVVDLIEYVVVDSIPYVRVADGYEGYIRQGQYRNTSTIKQYGWENSASLNIGPFSMKGTYSWNESRRIRRGLHEQTFYGLPSRIGHLSLRYALGGTSFMLSANFIGKSYVGSSKYRFERDYARFKWYSSRRSYSAALSQWMRPAYAVSDLVASQQLTPWATVTVNVTNLGNSYVTDESVITPALGRKTLIGLALRR